MIKINVLVGDKSWKKILINPETYIKRKVKKLSNDNYFKNKNIEFSILLTGNKKIKLLNQKFRKKNTSTDVLSFPYLEKKELKKKLKNKDTFYLGDIALNINKILNKKDNKKSKEKFNKLLIHGLTHLLGGRHKIYNDFINMQKLETKFLKSIN